jgi:hypothetical protein
MRSAAIDRMEAADGAAYGNAGVEVHLGEAPHVGIRNGRGTKSRIIAAGICSLGGLIFGYDLGALAAATESLKAHFHLSPALFGVTVSASLWGTVFGSLLAGRLADQIGRRGLIAGCASLYLLAAAVVALPFTATTWSSAITSHAPRYSSPTLPIRTSGITSICNFSRLARMWSLEKVHSRQARIFEWFQRPSGQVVFSS